jgi:hypothetical protein
MVRRVSGGFLMALTVAWLASALVAGQTGAPSAVSDSSDGPAANRRLVLKGPVPRTPDGKPDLRGHWNAPPLYNSNILEAHPAGFGIQAGRSVVVDPPDGIIPYQPWALAQRNENRKSENAYLDNEGRCYPSGVPRIMLFSFQIEYAANEIFLFFEYVHATRTIHMNRRTHLPPAIRSFFGDSVGYWNGDTLVVETANLNGKFWLGLGGDFFSDAATIVERFSLSDTNTLAYEATITDPKVFTRPWTWRWNRPYLRGEWGEFSENHCHEGNSMLAHLKNTYEATLAGKLPGTPAAAEARPMPAGQGPFSARWVYDQQASGRNEGSTVLPSEIQLAQTATELHLRGSTSRQYLTEAVYKLDGSEVKVAVGPGVNETGMARIDGGNLVIASRRSFSSPAGEVVAELNDVYTVRGDVLIVQRRQSVDGETTTAKAVYNRAK